MPNDAVRYLRLISEIQEQLEELREIPVKTSRGAGERVSRGAGIGRRFRLPPILRSFGARVQGEQAIHPPSDSKNQKESSCRKKRDILSNL